MTGEKIGEIIVSAFYEKPTHPEFFDKNLTIDGSGFNLFALSGNYSGSIYGLVSDLLYITGTYKEKLSKEGYRWMEENREGWWHSKPAPEDEAEEQKVHDLVCNCVAEVGRQFEKAGYDVRADDAEWDDWL